MRQIISLIALLILVVPFKAGADQKKLVYGDRLFKVFFMVIILIKRV